MAFNHRGQTLLKPISLRLTGCQKTLIMGPNGAGKSLLMRLAHGLLTPTSGQVRWQGAPPAQAMVFQRPVLLRRSALENLTYVLAINKTPRPELKGVVRKTQAMSALESLA
ncbi:hypothetical protein HSBAA_22850 [Vreelandella sulfidaeris]|uniref:ABC transporter domain-containing protein n=1 Tax=Vreelandella sulfidaeris TaxID=115553 RepID=A0A455U838_9GAMM|nr:hypothetical protein HSBAA_22850 [Halomonas sulfidaeris]